MRLKKALVVSAAVATFLFSTLGAYAATGVSAEEQRILDRLSAGVSLNGTVVQVPAEYYNMAVTELTNNAVDLTTDKVDSIIGNIDAAEAEIATDSSITSLADLKTSDKLNTIISYANTAANTANPNLTSVVDASGNVSIVDKSVGTGSSATASSAGTVAESGSIIKQTGFDLTQSVIVMLSLGTIMTACVFAANKKKLFVSDAEI